MALPGRNNDARPTENTGSTEIGGAETRGEHRRPVTTATTDDRYVDRDHAHEKFGGMNLGAGFFGWLVAVAMTILLISVVGAILTAIGSSTSVTQSQARNQAGTIGIATAIALLVILALAYYFGGYVAGRMSRFDGARQGALVWIIGLVVTIIAAVLGAVFGSQYNLLDRVNLPRLPISADQAGAGAIISVVVILVVTLLAAITGGKIGNHYHTRVDRAALR
jgi:MFS family permease